ncbi:MAG: c-type cytochrome [Saprospiraceae bacterium]|nr:c-type cytochrome [Saprospiraceae bacterium]
MKKRQFSILFYFLVLGFFSFPSCTDDKVDVVISYYGQKDDAMLKKYVSLPNIPHDYNFKLPNHTGLFSRPIDKDIATLGRVLFYDKNLSKDKTISCASCHKQELAFSDDVSFSQGVENRVTARNSIALGSVLNFAAYYGDFGGIPFFWDNRATRVQDQSKATLGNPLEMDMKMHEVADVVNNLEYYKPLIREAFHKENSISETEILDAIGTFVNSLTNYNTKFDRELDKIGINSINYAFTGFTQSENNGKKLYMSHCASCHGQNAGRPPVLSANNGLMLEYDDMGVGKHTNYANDQGKFKVPTLRNISRTAPYMHNGMFNTLNEVIDHYSSNIKNYKNLSQDLKFGNLPIKFNFTETEKQDLIAFLLTLNDDNITIDPKFSDPFLK